MITRKITLDTLATIEAAAHPSFYGVAAHINLYDDNSIRLIILRPDKERRFLETSFNGIISRRETFRLLRKLKGSCPRIVKALRGALKTTHPKNETFNKGSDIARSSDLEVSRSLFLLEKYAGKNLPPVVEGYLSAINRCKKAWFVQSDEEDGLEYWAGGYVPANPLVRAATFYSPIFNNSIQRGLEKASPSPRGYIKEHYESLAEALGY